MTEDKLENTYWNNKGKYQKQADILQEFVPEQGSSEYTDIELFRIASNVYYDIYNNGGCNLDRSRKGEFKILQAHGFDMPITEKIIEENENFNNGEFYGDPDQYLDEACIEIDNVLDQVIEKIRTMQKNHLELRSEVV